MFPTPAGKCAEKGRWYFITVFCVYQDVEEFRGIAKVQTAEMKYLSSANGFNRTNR